jgi:NADH-quinone oxidoreductase subunit J
MTLTQLIFYAFSVALIGAALMVIISKHPVQAVLYLVLAFFASAGLWLLLEAEFLALVLVLVYVGAVMTLFLFVVMMLNLDTAPQQEGFVQYLPLGILVLVLVLAALIYVEGPGHFGLTVDVPPPPAVAGHSNITDLGLVLYTDYVYPFELSAVLFLVAIIAAISLSLRKPRSKTQNINAQVDVNPAQRVRLVQMPAEKSQREFP